VIKERAYNIAFLVVLGRASRLRSVAAVSGERTINVLEQPPRWYTPFVALTPFRGMLAVVLVGAI